MNATQHRCAREVARWRLALGQAQARRATAFRHSEDPKTPNPDFWRKALARADKDVYDAEYAIRRRTL